uniref:RNA-dependent RNA polymerase n=1 Tax=Hubei odonate virus 15 TaxID=1922996 RepID=A0A1L3KP49_9VIRU|nr:RNA-dependent RNA polymerase [Hubei odonate virus 15]
MESYIRPEIHEVIRGLRTSSGVEPGYYMSLDEKWMEGERFLYNHWERLVTCEETLMYSARMCWEPDLFKKICEGFKIKPSYKLFDRCVKYARKNVFDVSNVFVDTFMIDENWSMHDYMVARCSKECLTFGTMPLYRWFMFFATLCKNSLLELRYIAGFVYKSNGPIFISSKRDHSSLTDVKLFYNLPNIVECLLNICELRLSLIYPCLRLNGELYDLGLVLDELALIVAVSPRIMIKRIRGFLNFVVRHAGSYSDKPSYIRHVGGDALTSLQSGQFEVVLDDKHLIRRFLDNATTVAALKEGREEFTKLGLNKLLALCEAILIMSFVESEEKAPTTRVEFTAACSFLLNIMRVAGYGRGLKCFAINKSKADRKDGYGGIAETVLDMWKRFDSQAKKAGFLPVNPQNFTQYCVGTWKATSSGMSPLKVNVTIDDKTSEVNLRKKAAVGALMGDKLFRRSEMNKKMDRNAPGKVGARDVPYKATRIIYPIRMATMNAQIAVAQHLVDYASFSTGEVPYSNREFSCDHVASGADDMRGVRIVDNLYTLITSGSTQYIALDLDMAGYDASCVWSNFRKPMLEALHSCRNDGLYGPDQLTWDELVEFAFGDGYVHNTYWDVGRVPMCYLNVDGLANREYLEQKGVTLRKVTIGVERREDLSRFPGLKVMPPGDYFVAEAAMPLELTKYFSIGVCMDGQDLLHMTSEGSGEKTTLCANSIENLAIQSRLFQDIKDTKLGRCVTPMVNRAVGDDISIILRIDDFNFDADDVEDFIQHIKTRLELYGFDISLPKTCFLPRQSEFVQTYAIRGLYIPKDQIMSISSEKPRRIDDPLAFMESMKKLYLSKVSRGYSESLAIVSIIYLYRYVMCFDIRRHSLVLGRRISKQCVREVPLEVTSMNIKLRPRLSAVEFKRKKSAEDVTVFFFSSYLVIFPHEAGGIGLNANSLMLQHNIPFFIYVASLNANKRVGAKAIALLSYLINLKWPKSYSSNDKVFVSLAGKAASSLIPVDTIFPLNVVRHLSKMTFSLGRLDAENVPSALMKKGLMFESFMKQVDFAQREACNLDLLHSVLNAKSNFAKVLHDCLELNFKYEFGELCPDDKESFVWNLEPMYCSLIRKLGLATTTPHRRDRSEKLRILIMREPALRSVRTPDDLISLFKKYSVTSQGDRDFGIILLMRMGFSCENANALFDVLIDSQEVLVDDGLFGALTDDLSVLMPVLDDSMLKSFILPDGIPMQFRYQIILFAMQIALLNFFTSFHKKQEVLSLRLPIAAVPCKRTSDSLVLNNYYKIPRLYTFMSRCGDIRTHLQAQIALAGDILDSDI